MKRKGKAVLLTAAALVLAAAALFAVYRVKSGGGKAREVTYTVRSETVTNVIEIAGAIAAAKEQNLQAGGDGTVTAVYVREGEAVKKGQVILQMDDSEQRYNLAKHDYDMEQKRLSGAPRDVELMEHQREVLVQKLRDRQIVANFDGVIAELTASAGDVFEAKDSAGVIIDRRYLAATVEVVETDAPKLKAGQKVSLTFPAVRDQTIEGIVDSFPATATKSSRGAAVVKAEIRVDNPPDVILPNYSFTGEIEISPPETLLLVEREAIGYGQPAPLAAGQPREGGPAERPARREATGVPAAGRRSPGGRDAAFADRITSSGEKERVSVSVVPYSSEFVRILSGLSEGDVLAAQETPRPSGWNSAGRQAGQTTEERAGQTPRRQQTTPTLPMMPGAPTGGGAPARPR